jgi:ABC-type arginine transport system ATPase subunit
VAYQVDETLNEPLWYSRVPNNLKKPFAWIMASGQTIRWATQQVVLQDILSGKDVRNLIKDETLCFGQYRLWSRMPLSKKATGFEINVRNLGIAENRILRR